MEPAGGDSEFDNTRIAENKEEQKKRAFKLTKAEWIEVPYRLLSSLSFIVFILIFGIPLWWLTTSTYRAKLSNFPDDLHITLPIQLSIITCNRSFDLQIETLSRNFLNAFQDLPQIPHLTLQLRNLHRLNCDSGNDVNTAIRTGHFHAQIAILDQSHWNFHGSVVHYGAENIVNVLHDEDDEKLFQRIFRPFVDVLLDVTHLSAIVKRDLRHRTDPMEIAAQPPNRKKRYVWDSVAFSAEYIVQIIFIHASFDTSKTFKAIDVVQNVRRFAMKIADVTRLSISSEHLWDFDLSTWMKKDSSDRWTLSFDTTSDIITQIDREISTVESPAPLLKLVIIDHADPIYILDQSGEIAEGLAIASWGAIFSHTERVRASASQAVVASLRALFGIDSNLPLQSSRHPSPLADWELERLKLRAFVDCAMNGMTSVRAIHKLIAKIDTIVISDQVAETVNNAVFFISEAVKTAANTGEMKIGDVIKGRALAEKAINDQSLLALLYFPSDQKCAVYLPLFLPILLPLLGSIMSLVKYMQGKLYW